jgi:hypothetical protein
MVPRTALGLVASCESVIVIEVNVCCNKPVILPISLLYKLSIVPVPFVPTGILLLMIYEALSTPTHANGVASDTFPAIVVKVAYM